MKPWFPTVIKAVVAEPLRKRGSVPVKLCLQAQARGLGLHGLWTLADLSLSLVLGIWDTVEELMSQPVEGRGRLGVDTHGAQGAWFTVRKAHPVLAG